MAKTLKELKTQGSKSLRVEFVTKRNKEGKEIRVSVEEIENGFLVTKNMEWNDPKKGWQHKTKRVFSATNPLEFNTDDKSLAEIFT